MPISDDDKKLLREDVSTLLQEQRETLASLREARMELKTEVAERLAAHQKLVQELEIYKWVIRFLFVIFLGGSIYGILNFVHFVDTRIADRVKKSDKLAQALSFAQLGQWGPALQTFDEVYNDYKTTNSFPDGEYLEFLYSKWIWILAQNDSQQNQSTWVGEFEWKILNDEREFRQGFLGNSAWKLNEAVQTNLAYCTLKFDKSQDAIGNARSYFEQALSAGTVSQATLDAFENSDPSVRYIVGVRMRRQKEVSVSVLGSRARWFESVPQRSKAAHDVIHNFRNGPLNLGQRYVRSYG